MADARRRWTTSGPAHKRRSCGNWDSRLDADSTEAGGCASLHGAGLRSRAQTFRFVSPRAGKLNSGQNSTSRIRMRARMLSVS
jgi:hypothetical protein